MRAHPSTKKVAAGWGPEGLGNRVGCCQASDSPCTAGVFLDGAPETAAGCGGDNHDEEEDRRTHQHLLAAISPEAKTGERQGQASWAVS